MFVRVTTTMTELNAGEKGGRSCGGVGRGREERTRPWDLPVQRPPFPEDLVTFPAGSGMPTFYSLVAYKCSGEGGGLIYCKLSGEYVCDKPVNRLAMMCIM